LEWRRKQLTEFVSNYGVWTVAAFIALESIGLPLPAEAALIAAAFFAARTHDIGIWSLIGAGIVAAIVGEMVGFWIGRRFGHQVLMRYGARVGFTEERIRIGQWLFVRYGGRFVFIARFLPFLRNIAAVLAGTNSMAQHSFYFASATAAAAWIITYGLSAYSFGEAFGNLASPVAVVLGLVATLMVLATPVLILRYERSLLGKVGRESPGRSESRRRGAGRVHTARVLAMNDAGLEGRRCVQRAVFADAAPLPRLIIEHPAEFRLPAISQWPDTVEGGSKCSAVR
jgi:membrane protein DedA with SNARE-associated domain